MYGNDFCTGDVDVFGRDDSGKDFRACLSFMRRNPSPKEVADTLLASGPLEIEGLPGYTALVLRAMDEVRTLVREKGRANVRRAAGLAV